MSQQAKNAHRETRLEEELAEECRESLMGSLEDRSDNTGVWCYLDIAFLLAGLIQQTPIFILV